MEGRLWVRRYCRLRSSSQVSRGMPDVRVTAGWKVCVRVCLRQIAPCPSAVSRVEVEGRVEGGMDCCGMRPGDWQRRRPRECVNVATEGNGRLRKLVQVPMCARSDGRVEQDRAGVVKAGKKLLVKVRLVGITACRTGLSVLLARLMMQIAVLARGRHGQREARVDAKEAMRNAADDATRLCWQIRRRVRCGRKQGRVQSRWKTKSRIR
ncbi:hypothetical protein F5X68DRAFT_4068 [Plectosphaerella plurivora]|uniref:Uncharacterized protein n=1 Tax=Plectosphaerella plurivora TaxID=936078 RepID=A0A9P8VLB9_9PEZI|nr:hypothetical protein F5X68DRAFT_4068 [Plectosphaerella plurivora]